MAQTMAYQWGPSVPLDETDGGIRPRPKRQNTHGSQPEREQRTMKSSTRRTNDYGGIQSDSEETRQRRKSVKAGNSAATRKWSRNALRDAAAGGGGGGGLDDSAWIHRDKLAQIEIQEMVDAGIPVRMSRRSTSAGPETSGRSRSASRSRKSMSKEQPEDELQGASSHRYTDDYDDYAEFERKRIFTIDQADEEEQAYQSRMDSEYHNSPEATAPRDGALSSSPRHQGRPSTSRIPLSKASAVPLPPNVVGRDSPLPRSRHGSQAASGNWDELMYARRARSNSVGSQVLLDDEGIATPPRPGSSWKPSPNNNSPPKSRSRAGGPTGSRKSSSNQPRPDSSAGRKASNAQRSTSRSKRLSGNHPPEGDPPWITDMYKPDPRLPPDQQMLPTHARRLAQQRWEKDGKTGTAYDRDLRLLNDNDFPPAPPLSPTKSDSSPPISAENRLLGDRATPPLHPRSPVPDRNETSSPTRSVTGGGYRITPTIQSPPSIHRSPTAYSQQTGMAAEPPTLGTRVADFNEKVEQEAERKGGCACCVVM